MNKAILIFLVFSINNFVKAQETPQMISVEGGVFIMGVSEEGEGTHIYNGEIGYEFIDGYKPNCCREKPAHQVMLSSYEIAKTETTVRQWRYFCVETNKDLPSYFSLNNRGYNRNPSETNDYPVQVNWFDAVEYCNWLSKKTGEKYRLPTEAEWEFSARGGNKSKGFKYAGGNNLETVGNEKGFNFVATKKPNELGLYDMSGNVWEWCNDYYYLYDDATVKNPKGPENFTGGRVIRGGGHIKMYISRPYGLDEFRVYAREYSRLNYDVIGFRVVKEVENKNIDNNLIEKEESFENQKKEEKTVYNTNGSILRKAHYINGVLNGKCINYTTEGGENVPKEEGDYVNGLKEGVWIIYEPIYSNDGNTLTGKYQVGRKETYVNDKRNGFTYSYYQNGSVFEKQNYVNDESHGEWIRYHENGKIRSKYYYENGNFIKEIIVNIKP